MAEMSRVAATPGARTRVAASSSPTSARDVAAPGGPGPAATLDPTPESSTGPTQPVDSGSTSEAEVARTARTGPLRDGWHAPSVSDAMSPGEVAVPATAAASNMGSHTSPGGSTTTRWPLLDDVEWLATRSTVVKVREGIL